VNGASKRGLKTINSLKLFTERQKGKNVRDAPQIGTPCVSEPEAKFMIQQ